MNKRALGYILLLASLGGMASFAANSCASVFEERYGSIWRVPSSETDSEKIKLAALQLRDLAKVTIDTQVVPEEPIEAFRLSVLNNLDPKDITITTLQQQMFPNFTLLKANHWKQPFWRTDYELLNSLYLRLINKFSS